MKVSLYAYKGLIVCYPESRLPEEGWVPTGKRGVNQYLGCVVLDTAKSLYASKEAIALLARITNGRDSIGDWSWWACTDGTKACSWWGPIYRLIDPDSAEAARNTFVHMDSVNIIPNKISKALRLMIDEAIRSNQCYYGPASDSSVNDGD